MHNHTAGWKRIAFSFGLLALRRPRITVIASLLIVTSSFMAATTLRYEGRLDTLLFDDKNTAAHTVDNGASSYIDMTFEGEILEEAVFSELRRLNADLLRDPAVPSIGSPFSIYLPAPTGEWDAAFPMNADPSNVFATMSPAERSILKPFIGDDGSSLRFIVSVTGNKAGDYGTVVGRLTDLAGTRARALGIKFTFSGALPLQAQLPDLIRLDQAKTTLAGLAAGFVIGVLLFRNAVFAIVIAVPSIFAVALVLATLAASGVAISVMSSPIVTLVLVLAIAEALHMVFPWLAAVQSGQDSSAALEGSVKNVAPIVLLTTGTTMVAFLAIATSDASGLRELGLIGAAGCVAVFIAATVFWPAFLKLLSINFPNWPHRIRLPHARPIDGPDTWIRTTLAYGLAVSGLVMAASLLDTSERFAPFDYLANTEKNNNEPSPAVHDTWPILMRLRFEDNTTLFDQRGWQAFAKAHELLEEAGFHKTASLAPVLAALDDGARNLALDYAGRIDPFSGNNQSILASDAPWIMISVPLSADLLKLRRALGNVAIQLENPGPAVKFEGPEPLERLMDASQRTISDLLTAAAAALAAALAVLAMVHRSVLIPIILVVPNVIPIVAVIAFADLFLGGVGLEVAVAASVAIGIVLDDSIHMTHNLISGGDANFVGNVLIATSALLIAGMLMMLLSSIPALRTYGLAMVVALATALACDLYMLPALFRRLLPHGGSR